MTILNGGLVMKLSLLIKIMEECLRINGDMDVVGMVDGTTYNEIEINCPDVESPMYIELYK
jgi:hypothetical protein